MGILKFESLPVNPLVGANWKTFKSVVSKNCVAPKYRVKYLLTKAICRVLSPFAAIQNRRYAKRLAHKELEHPPIFILGHWRSGTTYLHNVLSQDAHFGYNTTYQTVFPHLMMWGQGFFKGAMRLFLPNKRPTDGMTLDVDFPQEEEFALANMTPCAYYHFWFFPQRMEELADRYLTFETITESELAEFESEFKKLVNISLWNTKGAQFLSKNPPHTARIKQLLKIYPNAKFIYLIRNPYTVFESTRSFFNNTLKPLQLQDISMEELEQNILSIYMKLYRKYEADKGLIPKDNLVEIRFEDYEAAPHAITEMIYSQLQIPSYQTAKEGINSYIDANRGFKKSSYKYDPRTVELVDRECSEVMKKWGYEL